MRFPLPLEAMRTQHSQCCLNAHDGGSRMIAIVRLNRYLKKSWK
ncbi:hypothetical protein OHJ21_14380 [Virgibacillus sp. LDC1]|nr:hypothetical protein [Virgibacillus sp. LDC1]